MGEYLEQNTGAGVPASLVHFMFLRDRCVRVCVCVCVCVCVSSVLLFTASDSDNDGELTRLEFRGPQVIEPTMIPTI